MSDDSNLERELAAFGRTLEQATGEPISNDAATFADRSTRVPRRWWAIGGSAAAALVAIVGVAAVINRDADAPGPAVPPVSPPEVTSVDVGPDVSIPIVPDDPFGLLEAGWQLRERVEIDDWRVDDAFLCDSRIEAQVLGGLPLVQHTYERGPSFLVARFVDLGSRDLVRERFAPVADAEALCRTVEPDIDEVPAALSAGRAYGYSIGSRLAFVVPAEDGRAVHLTAGNITPREVIDEVLPRIEGFLRPRLEPVPDDPLGLEADGWRLVQRDVAPFSFPAELGCPGTEALVELSSAASVLDTLLPPNGSGLDIDVNIIDVGSLDVGNAVADAFLALGDCVAAEIGTEPEIGAMSSVRASWFRAGPEFAIVTIVGEGLRTIVIEIENAPFDDDLIADLVERSAAYLTPSADDVAPTTTMLLPLVPEESQLPVPDDPLGLEADGWVLAERTERAYVHDAELSDVECPEIDGRVEFDGVPMVFDLVEAPDGPEGAGLDSMRVTILELGERGRAEAFAALIADSAQCWAEFLPTVDPGEYEVVAGGAPELGARWYRVGIMIFVVVVGDDGTVVRLDPFGEDDALLAVSDEQLTELAQRAARFVAGRPTAVVRRPLTEFDGDPYEFSCDDTGPGLTSEIDYSPEAGPEEPLDRMPRDAFLDAIENVVVTTGRPVVAEAWTEWFADGDSYFVLEIDGQQAGLVTVAGWPDTGVWRFNSIDLCEAAFGTDLDR